MALIVRCLLTVISVITRQFGSLSIYLFMLIQISLARTVFNTLKNCHITPLLASLHWLKIKEHIEYKLLSLAYKILTTSQATYLHNLVSLQSPRGTRSSSYRHTVPTRITKCTKFGQLILRKIIKIVAIRCQILRLKCTKFDFGWGSAPDPAGRAYSAPQTP